MFRENKYSVILFEKVNFDYSGIQIATQANAFIKANVIFWFAFLHLGPVLTRVYNGCHIKTTWCKKKKKKCK